MAADLIETLYCGLPDNTVGKMIVAQQRGPSWHAVCDSAVSMASGPERYIVVLSMLVPVAIAVYAVKASDRPAWPNPACGETDEPPLVPKRTSASELRPPVQSSRGSGPAAIPVIG